MLEAKREEEQGEKPHVTCNQLDALQTTENHKLLLIHRSHPPTASTRHCTQVSPLPLKSCIVGPAAGTGGAGVQEVGGQTAGGAGELNASAEDRANRSSWGAASGWPSEGAKGSLGKGLLLEKGSLLKGSLGLLLKGSFL